MSDLISRQPTADVPERNVGKWIPVTERLPERYGRFIVTIVPDAGELWKTIELAMYSDLMGLVKTPVFWSGNVGKSDFEDVTSKVTAWMPAPEPYEGGIERTFEFPCSEYSFENRSRYLRIYELGIGRTVLFVPFTSLNYISVEEVEEEENDPEIQE